MCDNIANMTTIKTIQVLNCSLTKLKKQLAFTLNIQVLNIQTNTNK